jgi:hypothetical protein
MILHLAKPRVSRLDVTQTAYCGASIREGDGTIMYSADKARIIATAHQDHFDLCEECYNTSVIEGIANAL